MNRARATGLAMWGSVLVALLLSVLVLPESLRALKPFWLALPVIYWSLEAPERMNLGRAFLIGLLGDVFTGELLGEQALRLVAMSFIVLRLRARLRFFPMPQQSLAVLALLLNDRVVMQMVRSFTGEAMPDWTFWLGPLVGAVLWPWVFLGFDVLRLRARPREA
jgi:rod shape-determining protein MreD